VASARAEWGDFRMKRNLEPRGDPSSALPGVFKTPG